MLKSTFVSSERKRLPTRCQKRYARCGRPPESREPKTTSAAPPHDRLDQLGHLGRVVLHVGVLDHGDVAVDVRDRGPDRRALAAVRLPDHGRARRLGDRGGRRRSSRRRRRSSASSRSSRAIRSSTSPIVAASLYAGIRNETFTGRRSYCGPASGTGVRRDARFARQSTTIAAIRPPISADHRADEDRGPARARASSWRPSRPG